MDSVSADSSSLQESGPSATAHDGVCYHNTFADAACQAAPVGSDPYRNSSAVSVSWGCASADLGACCASRNPDLLKFVTCVTASQPGPLPVVLQLRYLCQRLSWNQCGVRWGEFTLVNHFPPQVNVRPSVFAYAAPLTAEAATEVKKVEKAVLSTTARAKAKAKEKEAGKAKASNGAPLYSQLLHYTHNFCIQLSELHLHAAARTGLLACVMCHAVATVVFSG